MQRANLTRVFMVNGVSLADPNPSLSVTDAVQILAASGRPDLATAEVQGPVVRGTQSVYTLHRAVGTKGRKAPGAKRRIESAVNANRQRFQARLVGFEATFREVVNPSVASAVAELFSQRRPGQTVLTLPGQVMPCLG